MTALLAGLLALPALCAQKKVPSPPAPAVRPGALPASAVAVPPAAKPSVAGPVAQAIGAAARSVEAAAKGAESNPRAAGEAIQSALEGVAVVKPKEPAPPAPAKGFAAALEAVSAEAARRGLASPAFVSGELEGGAWEFSFVAGGHGFSTYAAYQGRVGASWRGESAPVRSVELSKESFARMVELTPVRAFKAAKLGTDRAVLGLSIALMPKSRDLWYVVDHEDGRRVAVNARSGRTRVMPSGPDRARIESAVASAGSYKGRPWSSTEFNMNTAFVESALLKDGATLAQLRLFRRLLAAVPIKGGSFNPWSGD